MLAERLYLPAQAGSFPTPRVDFDGELGLLRLEGESHPEEAAQFYAPLILWLDMLITSPPASVVFELRLTFFSAATRPQLLALLRRLKKWANRGAEVRATWYIDPGDEDMVDVAGDLAMMSGLAIRVVSTVVNHSAVLGIAV
ncbi:SiaC family regulatory phosphoprotein [Nannocystis punicea]|uniref:SiaC family regulatory phosphoprotein n=1 Tax=Nannocystis punicea TaxID=2995304 RepID=A0ABY7H5C8_9BACT|nr:SiaC family regulatory phosphoprotein [Nannocystis poenicansa]WAS94493.1 SiaC family regulatory phosphoprotein [Nannocystis poenicansa]